MFLMGTGWFLHEREEALARGEAVWHLCRLFPSESLQQSILAPVLFNTLINDLYKRFGGLLIKSAGGTELGDLPNMQDDRMKLQFKLNRLEDWTERETCRGGKGRTRTRWGICGLETLQHLRRT